MKKQILKSWLVFAAMAVAASQTYGQSGVTARAFVQFGAGAVARPIVDKLGESVSVTDYGADGTGAKDSTAALQRAIDYAAAKGKTVTVPAGVYKLVPATAVTDESGSGIKAAIIMRSGMHVVAEPGAVLRIADGVSTDAAPQQMRGFFSNQPLHDVSFVGLTVDMNGQNNKMSPGRASRTYNRFTQAAIAFSGTPAGVAARGDNVLIDRCTFLNGPGASVIVMGQSNTAGVQLGKGWTLTNNTFYNNGFDTDDHSSVFGWATDVKVSGNTFDNPAPWNVLTRTGGQVAYEIHGSRTTFANNRINNYYQGAWIGANLTEPVVRGLKLADNTASVSETFSDFYAANLSSGASPESAIADVAVTGNVVEVTADTVDDTVKACFKIAARKQPAGVRIAGNSCRAYDTTKNVVMTLLVVGPNQLAKADQITVESNKGAGLVAGLVAFFSGNGSTADTQNVGRVTFANNELGALVASPGGIYTNTDVILYGPSAGRFEALRLYGMQSAVPVSVDAPSGGRATVYGKAVLPVAVTWNGVKAIGNGATSGRIAIDTDTGFAALSLQISFGNTTTFTGGNVYPSFAGLVANSNGAVSGILNQGATSYPIAGRVDNTGSWVTLFTSSGALSNTLPTGLVGASLSLGGTFPVASAAL